MKFTDIAITTQDTLCLKGDDGLYYEIYAQEGELCVRKMDITPPKMVPAPWWKSFLLP